MTYTGQQQIRLIRKDQDGCFLSTVVAYWHQRQLGRPPTTTQPIADRSAAPLSVIWWL